MSDRARTSRGSSGGAADEAGGQYRRGVAALFVAYGLNGLPLQGLPVHGDRAAVDEVALETGFPIDDVLVRLRGGRLFVQAKRALDFHRSMREVTGQWIRAVRDPDFNPEADLVVAVAGTLSPQARTLARALDRRRLGATNASSLEERAFQRLQRLLKNLGAIDSEVDRLLSRAVIMPLQVEAAGEEHAERGRLLLDGHVVAKGHGSRAWRELIAIASDAARLRLGYSIGAWLDQLRGRDVPLTIDAEASRAGYLEARRVATERYRQELQYRGEHVTLTSLGFQLPPIPLSAVDAEIRVHDPASADRDGGDLLWSFRRRGRVVLTGLPGGGKSTALAATAAAWVRHEQWALPIVISLRRLAEQKRFRNRPLRDEILDLAVEIVPPRDRGLVRDVLDNGLGRGDVVLFLDGLDEAADRRLLLAHDIQELLRELHADTDVLLATRDLAYADARILEFKDLRLGPPREILKTVVAVLAAIASHRRIAGADVWIASRVEWVQQTLAADSQLKQAPLMPVLLTLLAADGEPENLPSRRSVILQQVVEGVVRRREFKREIRVSGLADGHEIQALLDAFPIIASALAGSGGKVSRAQLTDALGIYLERQWALVSGPARATAEQILVFWDESGIFVASGQEKHVAPRLQLFLEIGVAMSLAASPELAPEWIEANSRRPESKEALLLAASLSRPVAEALIERVCRVVSGEDAPLAILAAEALGQGGTASDSSVRQLIACLLPLLVPGDDQAWEAARSLVRMAVPNDLQESVLKNVRQNFPESHAAVATGIASVAWAWPAARRDEALEQALRVRDLLPLARRMPRTSRYLTRTDWFADPAFTYIQERATAILLPHRPDIVPLVVAAIGESSIGTAHVLDGLLRRYGYTEAADSAEQTVESQHLQQTEAMEDSARRWDEGIHDTLRIVASLSEPADLTLQQQRRAKELASFAQTLNLNNTSAWMSGKRLRPLRGTWIRLIANLGGFDTRVLAAQAKVIQDELVDDSSGGHRALFSLMDTGRRVEPTQWNLVDGLAGARQLLLAVLHGPRGSAAVAAQALSRHPDRRGTAEAIAVTIPNLSSESVRPAVWAILHLSENSGAEAGRLALSTNAHVREAIASLVSLTVDDRPNSIGVTLANDHVRQVRLAVISHFERHVTRPTLEMIALLIQMSTAQDGSFSCNRCQTTNEASLDSCAACYVVTKRPSIEAARVVKKFCELYTSALAASRSTT